MKSKDTGNYSHAAEFETEVYPNVYWVPINTLGKSRYTAEDINAIVHLSPDEKKERICNLYEAVQLFQASDFRGCFDNTNHWINDSVFWQTHKNQKDAVISNEGCCATDTNWLAYFIQDHYDAVDSFCYANKDGNGHITTCIRQGGYFFLLDMMMCRNDSQSHICKESGVLSELMEGEWNGFLYKCKDPVDYCRFHISRCQAKNRPAPFCFYIRETSCVFATGISLKENGLSFLVPENEKPRIVCCDGDEAYDLLIVDLPKQILK